MDAMSSPPFGGSNEMPAVFPDWSPYEDLDSAARAYLRDPDVALDALVGVLRGAVMVMADLARAFNRHLEMDWMAVSSYGSGTKSSGARRSCASRWNASSTRSTASGRRSSSATAAGWCSGTARTWRPATARSGR